uniref:Uncharacterized protein n=1 Tax=Nelumbo nucifera TaxID=4432 RepID=A0A822YBV2_NELNU|nr:TPA_asm: hypothetical protein HUJ06_010455 [Nelumbo nucifera]
MAKVGPRYRKRNTFVGSTPTLVDSVVSKKKSITRKGMKQRLKSKGVSTLKLASMG